MTHTRNHRKNGNSTMRKQLRFATEVAWAKENRSGPEKKAILAVKRQRHFDTFTKPLLEHYRNLLTNQ
jgi:hypothetical protein